MQSIQWIIMALRPQSSILVLSILPYSIDGIRSIRQYPLSPQLSFNTVIDGRTAPK